MSKTAKFVAFSCTHAPVQDTQAVDWLCKQIADVEPDYVIHLGDMLEAAGASRFPGEESWDLKDEFDEANIMMRQIRTAHADAQCVFLFGNHDHNILDRNRIDKKLRGLCDFRDHVPELDNWLMPTSYNYCRKRGVFRLGQVDFAHGYEANASAGKYEAMYLSHEYHLYVHGHTHRPHQVRQVMANQTRPLRQWYANPGTLGDMDRHYMERKRKALWGQGCVVGETVLTKSPRRSVNWSAETRVFRMFDDVYCPFS